MPIETQGRASLPTCRPAFGRTPRTPARAPPRCWSSRSHAARRASRPPSPPRWRRRAGAPAPSPRCSSALPRPPPHPPPPPRRRRRRRPLPAPAVAPPHGSTTRPPPRTTVWRPPPSLREQPLLSCRGCRAAAAASWWGRESGRWCLRRSSEEALWGPRCGRTPAAPRTRDRRARSPATRPSASTRRSPPSRRRLHRSPLLPWCRRLLTTTRNRRRRRWRRRPRRAVAPASPGSTVIPAAATTTAAVVAASSLRPASTSPVEVAGSSLAPRLTKLGRARNNGKSEFLKTLKREARNGEPGGRPHAASSTNATHAQQGENRRSSSGGSSSSSSSNNGGGDGGGGGSSNNNNNGTRLEETESPVDSGSQLASDWPEHRGQRSPEASSSPDDHMLSSSLEAEHRLLREMGWTELCEQDEAFEPLTEDEMKEFQRISEKLQSNGLRRNGLLKHAPATVTITSPALLSSSSSAPATVTKVAAPGPSAAPLPGFRFPSWGAALLSEPELLAVAHGDGHHLLARDGGGGGGGDGDSTSSDTSDDDDL
ncbi:uncharacterized protein LOC144953240 isoform X3 [Lampetra fluviatilis]